MSLYNEEQKLEYIETRERKQHLINLFSKSASLEEEYGKDISLFSVDEILQFYKVIDTKSLDVLNNINSWLNLYTSWCMSRLLLPTGINNYQEITIEMMSGCVNKLAMENVILSEEDIFNIVNKMQNAREKFLLLMVYETGRIKNLANVFEAKLHDFDMDNRILKTVDGRTVHVSRDLCRIAREADETLEYRPYIISDSPKVINRKRYLVDHGFIYKETDTARSDNPRVKQGRMLLGLKKSFDIIGVPKWISIKDFDNSGVINRFKRIASETGMETEDIIRNKKFREYVEYQHAYKIPSHTAFIRRFREFL